MNGAPLRNDVKEAQEASIHREQDLRVLSKLTVREIFYRSHQPQ